MQGVNNKILFTLIILSLFFSCTPTAEKELPIIGNHEFVPRVVDGETITDTIYHSIPDFSFVNQDGITVTEKVMEGKLVVGYFFFTHCPTICPKMLTQMKRVQASLADKRDVLILAHSIDTKNDTVERLKWYVEENGINTDNWQFLTGDFTEIQQQGIEGYYLFAGEDKAEVGGYAHSEKFILVDKQKHIRGLYDGTNPDDVDQLIQDINLLRHETK